jgi:hypothetical protein
MKLYFFTTDTGFFEYLFTTDEQQAVQTFAIYLVLSKTPVSKMWFTEVTTSSVGCEYREHLREALSQCIEAFGSYQTGKGWELRLVQNRFDELSHQSEGDAQ